MENYMFEFSRVGNPTKLFIFPQDRKTKKYRVYHNTSINNYLQDTQQNIYFFEWRGNARRALASVLIKTSDSTKTRIMDFSKDGKE